MNYRERLRLAQVLQATWQMRLRRQRDAVVPISSAISTSLQRLRHVERRLAHAHEHGWSLIAPVLEQQVLNHTRHLRLCLQDLEDKHFPVRHPFPLRDFYQDLVQLQHEFADLRVNWEESLLVVITESITLRGIDLGSFSIRFYWNAYAQGSGLTALEVLANEPNAAAMNEEISHPHVRDGELCSGDAIEALSRALEEGRLAEAFLLVQAVLTNYNPQSAYVRLEEWQGLPCYDCGAVVDHDHRFYCEGCDNDYCDDCCSGCTCCGLTRCLSCLDSCSVCHERCCSHCCATSAVTEQLLCRSCQDVCPGCLGLVGPADLDDETGLYPDYHNLSSNKKSDETLRGI